ncbi:Insulin-degrading enzyme [Galdieria sulphuraria]|nr:Insulin-degrading enzyme [Galdieria sulphuraria]
MWIEKPKFDTRQYRALCLNNELRVLLISDAESEKAAAALNVSVGYFSDPPQIPGLAHLLEHLLFLGSEKYPDESEYHLYLSQHGGTCNAFTAEENTCFHFDVTDQRLSGALDRFAQFFIAPLLKEEVYEREVRAVDSEHYKNILNDSRRFFQVFKCVAAEPRHPLAKFGTGNHETLYKKPRTEQVDVVKCLKEFHSTFYSSNLMTLCVLSRQSLDNLEQLVVPLFSSVPNRSVLAPYTSYQDLSVFKKDGLGSVCKLVPVQDRRTLQISWPFPELFSKYEKKPEHYLSHLLGHESKGSLYYLLKEKGWINNLSCGPDLMLQTFSTFGMTIELTEMGLVHVEDILYYTYEYVDCIRNSNFPSHIFEESQKLEELRFHFQERSEPLNEVVKNALNMQYYPLSKILSGPYLIHSFDANLILSLLEDMVPSKMCVMLSSKTFEGLLDEREPWYGTYYGKFPLSGDLLFQLSSVRKNEEEDNLYLPSPNPFIPGDFSLKCQPGIPSESQSDKKDFVENGPKQIRKDAIWTIHHQLDDRFQRPKVHLYFFIHSAYFHFSPRQALFSKLYCLFLEDILNEYGYYAQLAGIHYQLDITNEGLILFVGGYNDRISNFVLQIFEEMVHFRWKREHWHIKKDLLKRQLENSLKREPFHLALQEWKCLVIESQLHLDDLLESVDLASENDIDSFHAKMFEQVHLEALMYGNILQEEALEMSHRISSILPVRQGLKEQAWPVKRIVQIPLLNKKDRHSSSDSLTDMGIHFIKNARLQDEENGAVLLYFQVDQQELYSHVILELLEQIMSKHCFDDLRTTQQLGYVVATRAIMMSEIAGLLIIVQSSAYSTHYVEKKIQLFLENFYENVLKKGLTEDELADYLQALRSEKLEPAKRLSQQAAWFWSEISSHSYYYTRFVDEAACLNDISRNDLLNCFHRYFLSDEQRRITVHIQSNKAAQDSITYSSVFTDATLFKRSQFIYPIRQLLKLTNEKISQ